MRALFGMLMAFFALMIQPRKLPNPKKETPMYQPQSDLDELWREVQEAGVGRDVHAAKPAAGANVVLALGWCLKAEKALDQPKPDLGVARYAMVMARHQLKRAEELRGGWHVALGVVATITGLIWLVGLGWIIYTQTWAQPSEGFFKTMVAWVPIGGFVWGALGGGVWTAYWSAFWTKRRLFNGTYFVWHLIMPILGALAGATLSAASQVGLLGLALDSSKPNAAYSLVLVSFVSGLFVDRLLDMMQPIAGKFLGMRDSANVDGISESTIAQEGQKQV